MGAMKKLLISYAIASALLLSLIRVSAQDPVVVNNSNGAIQGFGPFFNNAGTFSVFSSGGSFQRGFVTIGAAALSASSTFTVVNADFVGVTLLGFEGTTSTTACPTADSNGIVDTLPCNAITLTTAKISATQLQVTATRFSLGNSTAGAQASIGLADLNPVLVDNVQRGTIPCCAVQTVVTACPAGLSKSEVRNLGTDGRDIGQELTMGTATQLQMLGNFASVITGWQVICWR